MNIDPTRTNGFKIHKRHSNVAVKRHSFSQRITDSLTNTPKILTHQIYCHIKLN